jgi:hypothetical protein
VELGHQLENILDRHIIRLRVQRARCCDKAGFEQHIGQIKKRTGHVALLKVTAYILGIASVGSPPDKFPRTFNLCSRRLLNLGKPPAGSPDDQRCCGR